MADENKMKGKKRLSRELDQEFCWTDRQTRRPIEAPSRSLKILSGSAEDKGKPN